MRIKGCGPAIAAWVVIALLAAGRAEAGNNPNGIVFRAVGWFKGKAEITAGQIKCEIPTVTGAIADGAYSVGLWNTYGSQTLFFPDANNPLANPCGGWLQIQNNLRDQALNVDHIDMKFKIAHANRFRQFVVTRKNFPVACRELKKDTLFAGARLNPVNSDQSTSGSGASNVTLIQILPMISPQMLSCLRGQYAGLSTDVFTSLPLVISTSVVAVSDSGQTYRSNSVGYHLTIRHTCGNGRVDDGEICDPTGPDTCVGSCSGGDANAMPPTFGTCTQAQTIACLTNADCQGICLPPGNPSECVCVY